ncbi:MFS-type transporter SLC18B1 isoform X4 [Monodon monoceros]|uniref:MFS-type transporter SLC18B1 isoform X4 n=1 Tax=Monodon monoceros TaxID=40151 RepID=UPI0010F5C746|nr:MFS-type transporter SLC18B1 isoform X4 [Monodon monoceros]
MDSPGDPEGPRPPGGDGPPGGARETSRQLSREQIFVLISAASINLGSMMCYSILGPFFPKEAEKKGASNTVIGMIFGCYAFFNLLASLVFGKYLVHIGAKFMFVAGMFVSGGVTVLFGVLDQVPEGPVFIAMCFLVRIIDAISFAAAITASSSILAKAFPNNVATVMGSLETFSGLGLVLGPPLGGFLYQSFGYEVPFILLGCIVLLMVPLNMCILPNYESDPGKHSFWKLIILPKVAFISLVITSLSSGFGFLDPTLSLFVLEKSALVVGADISHKWYLCWNEFNFNFPRDSQLRTVSLLTTDTLVSLCSENGFEEGLSTLGLVSGLFGALWSVGAFVGPTLGGFLYEKIGFEWAAALQGLWALTSGLVMGLFYLLEHSRRRRRSKLQNSLGTEEERTALLPDEM